MLLLIALVARFTGKEEERLIAPVVNLGDDDRAAQHACELIPSKIVHGAVDCRLRKGSGVRVGIAQIPEGETAVAIGSGFGCDTDNPATASAILRIEAVGLHSNLLYGFRRKGHRFASQTHARVVDSVGNHAGASCTAAVHLQVITGHGRPTAQLRIFAAYIATDVRDGDRQIKHAAVRQRRICQHAL